jgi:hypothetical protein
MSDDLELAPLPAEVLAAVDRAAAELAPGPTDGPPALPFGQPVQSRAGADRQAADVTVTEPDPFGRGLCAPVP